MSTILVTGPTGQVGGALVEELVRRDAQTRAMVRTEERADALAARSVDVVVADLSAFRPTLAGTACLVGMLASALTGNVLINNRVLEISRRRMGRSSWSCASAGTGCTPCASR